MSVALLQVIVIDTVLILFYLAVQFPEFIIEPDGKTAIDDLVMGYLRKIGPIGHRPESQVLAVRIVATSVMVAFFFRNSLEKTYWESHRPSECPCSVRLPLK